MTYFVYLVTDREGFFPLLRTAALPTDRAFPGLGISLLGSFDFEDEARRVYAAAESLSQRAYVGVSPLGPDEVAAEALQHRERRRSDRRVADRRVADRRGPPRTPGPPSPPTGSEQDP